MIHGNNILIYEGATPTVIAASKSCDIDYSADTIEVSSPPELATDDGTHHMYIVGRRGWKVSMSYLVTNFTSGLLRVGNTYTLTIGQRTDTTDRLTGAAICTQCKITATRGNLVQGSFQFQGTGALTAVE